MKMIQLRYLLSFVFLLGALNGFSSEEKLETQKMQRSFYISSGLLAVDLSNPGFGHYFNISDFSDDTWGASFEFERAKFKTDLELSRASFFSVSFIVSRKISDNFFLDFYPIGYVHLKTKLNADNIELKVKGRSYGVGLRYRFFIGRFFGEFIISHKRYSFNNIDPNNKGSSVRAGANNVGLGLGLSF